MNNASVLMSGPDVTTLEAMVPGRMKPKNKVD